MPARFSISLSFHPRLPLLLALLLTFPTLSIVARAQDKPAKVVANHAVPLNTRQGNLLLPAFLSLDGEPIDFTQPQPQVTRAILILHGLKRNAQSANDAGLDAIHHAGPAAKGTLLIAPQFLEQVDVDAHRLPPNVLRWAPGQWMAGARALNTQVSSFDALDGILTLLANRHQFPNLKVIVLAGHSAGGQLMQRYAVAGRGADLIQHTGIAIHYVIANPSSYLYFSPDRPVLTSPPSPDFTFASPADPAACKGKFNRWKYGLTDTPAYIGSIDPATLETHYLTRHVRYLLGTSDNDPHHPELDTSCSGELEGPTRFERGKAYFRYLQLRHPELTQPNAIQQLWFIPGVDHDADRMFNSTCGLAALFDTGPCPTQELNPRP